jgi:hypothetical protein
LARIWISAVILSLLLALSLGRAQSSTQASVTLTVRVLPVYAFVVELYDENGELIDRAQQTTPPLNVEMTIPGGQTVALYAQNTPLGGSAIIRIYVAGTVPNRGIIDEADSEGGAMGMISIPELEAIEIVSDKDLDGRAMATLSYPPSIETALVKNLAVFGLDESAPRWTRLPSVKVDHSKQHISVKVDGFSVYRVMAQVATDLADVVVYPNPFVPLKAPGGCLRFVKLTAEAAISI